MIRHFQGEALIRKGDVCGLFADMHMDLKSEEESRNKLKQS